MAPLLRIAPLLAAFFCLQAPSWAMEARTKAVEVGGAVATGNPLSGQSGQAGSLQSSLSAPGLVPGLKSPLGVPVVEQSKSASAPLPLPQALTGAPVQAAPLQAAPVPELPKPAVEAPAASPLLAAPESVVPAGQEATPAQDEPPLIKKARRYIRDIMGSRKPTDAETEALLTDYMELQEVDPGSAQGRQLRSALLASKLKAEAAEVSKLDPRYKDAGPFILAAAKEYGVTPAHVVAAVEKRKLGGLLAGAKSKEQADRILDSVLARDRFETFMAGYPKNRQGDLMRDVASHMLVRSGKSIEEVSRDGVFVYADFNGRSLTNASVGRDPDPQSPNVLFYVRFQDSKWRIDVYRQNRGRGFQGGSDLSFVEAFQHWLASGGIPRAHFK